MNKQLTSLDYLMVRVAFIAKEDQEKKETQRDLDIESLNSQELVWK